MKVIETLYNGRLYRSRLEARWAVYFDALGIKFLYEPEGFELSNGQRYLPDFFLPNHECYAEVKPFEQTDPRWKPFVKESRQSLILLFGEPSSKPKTILMIDDEQVFEALCCIVAGKSGKFFPLYYAGGLSDDYYSDFPNYREAEQKANSARFGT